MNQQTIQVNNEEIIVLYEDENLQELLDTILCSAAMLDYEISFSNGKMRAGECITLSSHIYRFYISLYYYVKNDEKVLTQIYITDKVNGAWDSNFRALRCKTCGEINSIHGVGYSKVLKNFLKMLSIFDPKTGVFNEVKK